jgi:hypothetical protein
MKGWKVYLLPGVAALLLLFYYLVLRPDVSGTSGADTPAEPRRLPGADAPPRRSGVEPEAARDP